MVPPRITHDINILLPRELKKTSFYLANAWDCTKTISKFVSGEKIYGDYNVKKQKVKINTNAINLDLMSTVKLDTVLIIIMNGNDYLPKVRGVVGGFDSFFTQYFKLVKDQLKKDKNSMPSAFLLSKDNDRELSINVPFALQFFKQLSKHQSDQINRSIQEDRKDNFQIQLGLLSNLCDAKILPYPLNITRISRAESHFESELSQMNTKLKSKTRQSIAEVYGPDIEIVRMTLGNYPFETGDRVLNTTILGESDGHGVVSRMIPNEDNEGRSYLFEVPHREGTSISATKHRLSCLALEEVFGKENMHLFGYDDLDIEEDSVGPNEKVSLDLKMCLVYTYCCFTTHW